MKQELQFWLKNDLGSVKKTKEIIIRMTYLKHYPIEYLSGSITLHFIYLFEKMCSKKKETCWDFYVNPDTSVCVIFWYKQ